SRDGCTGAKADAANPRPSGETPHAPPETQGARFQIGAARAAVFPKSVFETPQTLKTSSRFSHAGSDIPLSVSPAPLTSPGRFTWSRHTDPCGCLPALAPGRVPAARLSVRKRRKEGI